MLKWLISSLALASLLAGSIAGAAADGEEKREHLRAQLDDFEDSGPFRSLTEGLNFKVNYRVQSFLDGQPVALIDLRESYHSSLAAGLIKHTLQRRNPLQPWRLSRQQRKIFYDAQLMRLLEYSGADKEAPAGDQHELLGDDFFLHENGGSTGYARSQDDNASHRQWQRHSARLHPAGESLDALTLLAGLKAPPALHLDAFMRPQCVETIRNKLHYINGLTRLLLMIECRRQEFKLSNEPARASEQAHPAERTTRGLARLVYAAANLPALTNATSAGLKQMDVTVTIPVTRSRHSRRDQAAASSTLAANCVPLSVVLNLAHNGHDILLIVNVFQFETVGAAEHVSESSSDAGHSSYLLPLNQIELSQWRSAGSARDQHWRPPLEPADGQPEPRRDRFSFRASLTMSRGDSGQLLSDPVELVVVYDGRAALLATQMEFVDRSRSSGPLEGWRRDYIRTLYDGHSNTKYHMMRANFNYNNRDELGQERAPPDSEPFGWRACATDTLASMAELRLLEEGAGELFDTSAADANFMGTALVRGVLCHVFERRLFTLPKLLGLTMNDYAHMRPFTDSEIYLQIYVAAGRHDKRHFLSRQMAGEAARGKPLRLDVRLVGRLGGEMASFRLELSSFDWSVHLLEEAPGLLDVARACLAADFQARHSQLELSLSLERSRLRDAQLNKYQTEALRRLSEDASLLQTAVARLLVDSLAIGVGQQVDLEATMAGLDFGRPLGSQLQIEAKLSVYEEPREQLADQLLGYGQLLGLAPRQALSFAPNLGARVYSYDECRWRAAHTLVPSRLRPSAALDEPEAEASASSRIFMFCPHSLLCVLGDPSWRPVQTERRLTLEGLFQFPYPSNEPLPAAASDRCAFFALELREREPGTNWRSRREQLQGSTGARSPLDSLEAQRLHGFRRLRDQPFELQLEPAAGGPLVSLPLAASRVKLSPTFNGGSQAGLLTRPLSGVAYAVGERTSGGDADGDPAAGNNDGSQEPQPLLASRLAECARNCLLLHNCGSYSACHVAGGRLACLFSSLDWSRPADFERLRLLASAKRGAGSLAMGTGHKAAQFELQLEPERDNGAGARVQLRRSKLCSLYARPHAQLFKSSRGYASGVQKPAGKFLLPASSADQCARFCQERAHLARQLAALHGRSNSSSLAQNQLSPEGLQTSRASWARDSLSKFRVFACSAFNFLPATGSCQLLPMLDHWSLLGLEHLLQPDGKSGAKELEPSRPSKFNTIERWRSQLRSTRVPSWLERDRSDFQSADEFQLDFEQLFIDQRGRRLKLDENCQLATRRRLQLKIGQLELKMCANRCIHLLACRSFDYLQSTEADDKTLCVLSAVSAADLTVAPESWPMFEYVAEAALANSSSVWWHYEPSELALFMLADPHETDGTLLGRAAELVHADQRDDRGPILIRPLDSNLLASVFTAHAVGAQ